MFLAFKMPGKYRPPLEMNEAMLVCELGLPPQVIADMDEGLIQRMLIYRGVKAATEHGGNWQP